MATELDDVDLRLLEYLQEYNLQTADELADRVGRSPSVVGRRLRRLRRSGFVTGDVSIVSEEAAGYPLFALVHIQLERHSPQPSDLLRRHLVGSANVQLCLDIAGAFDMLILVVAADMDEFNAITERLLAADPAVRRFETTFVKRRAKATLTLPVRRGTR
ncbi:MAG: Lrp/AsnC family transcriptional regulator [Pseudomonadota bacterium]|nr:Lrp/AsnC family transcriptional regulator [Sphingomonas sp.]MDQ3478553.1 Lrp/AsnC family transcriptional regulator [Pseudomonadota bacterium]